MMRAYTMQDRPTPFYSISVKRLTKCHINTWDWKWTTMGTTGSRWDSGLDLSIPGWKFTMCCLWRQYAIPVRCCEWRATRNGARSIAASSVYQWPPRCGTVHDKVVHRWLSVLPVHQQCGWCQNLQEDLNRLREWETRWRMSFNPEKCEVLHIILKQQPLITNYFIHGTMLNTANSAKYLGLTIDSKLTFNNHVSAVCKKANATRAFISRTTKFCPRDVKAQAYTTYVRCHSIGCLRTQSQTICTHIMI